MLASSRPMDFQGNFIGCDLDQVQFGSWRYSDLDTRWFGHEQADMIKQELHDTSPRLEHLF
jgi:hypothetical protein